MNKQFPPTLINILILSEILFTVYTVQKQHRHPSVDKWRIPTYDTYQPENDV